MVISAACPFELEIAPETPGLQLFRPRGSKTTFSCTNIQTNQCMKMLPKITAILSSAAIKLKRILEITIMSYECPEIVWKELILLGFFLTLKNFSLMLL